LSPVLLPFLPWRTCRRRHQRLLATQTRWRRVSRLWTIRRGESDQCLVSVNFLVYICATFFKQSMLTRDFDEQGMSTNSTRRSGNIALTRTGIESRKLRIMCSLTRVKYQIVRKRPDRPLSNPTQVIKNERRTNLPLRSEPPRCLRP
jgi:hypothetical protein